MSLRSISNVRGSRTEGDVDVRKWEVRTRADDEKVGKVDDVLVDDGGTARYLDVDLGLLKKHVLLPVGQAQVDASRDVVWINGLRKDELEDIPAWDGTPDRLDDQYESRLGQAYAGKWTDERYYDRPEYTASWWRGTDRTRQATADEGTTHARLRRLSELKDYEVADDEPDPRGWEVQAGDGRTVGRVDELIVEPAAMKARYLDVVLDSGAVNATAGDRHVLVPVGFVRLDEDADRVLLDSVQSSQIAAMPAHEGEIARSHEDALHDSYAGHFTGENRYAHPRYRTDFFYGERRVIRTDEARSDREDIRR